MDKPQVAFLGMGLMGVPMSLNLLRAGYPVRCYNRTAAKTEPVVEAGGVACVTPAEAARGAAVIISCVTDGPDVERVLLGEQGAASGAAPGALLIDMSTISPAVSTGIGQRLRERGLRFLEAPVTGGTIGATNGTLSILAGGAEADFDEARPVLAAMGANITHCGGWGAGQGVKLCNQIMGAMNLLGVCEAFALARGMNIDPAILVQALGGGAANSWALANLAPKILADDWAPGFMVDTQQKDMRLVAEAAEQVGVALPGAALMTQLWRSAQAHGEGAEGIHAADKVLRRLSGI
ncbi:MAG: NAD(P)-dependent oxidoreductase [Armatimonadetes bacterium]|nr:NAD(P)-dependent oxidoreductase [Armatimonadota bacterium]